MEACGKACGKRNVQATGLPPNLTQQYYLVRSIVEDLEAKRAGKEKEQEVTVLACGLGCGKARVWRGGTVGGIGEVVSKETIASEGSVDSPEASEG